MNVLRSTTAGHGKLQVPNLPVASEAQAILFNAETQRAQRSAEEKMASFSAYLCALCASAFKRIFPRTETALNHRCCLGSWVLVFLWSITLCLHAADSSSFTDSIRHERSGNYTQAIAALSSAPRDYTGSLRLGWLHYLKGDAANSITHYHAALTLAPRSVEARLGLILPLLADKQFSTAESLAREILRENKSHYLAQLRLATALRLQGKLRDADRVLARALDQYPSDSGLLTERGLVKRAQQQLPAARYYLGQAEMLDPDNDAAFAALADPLLFRDLATVTAPTSPGFTRGLGFRVGDTPMRLDATFYGGVIDYQGTQVKDSAKLWGLATWLGVGKSHAFETAFDFIEVSRVGLPKLKQLDVTAAYDNFSIANWRLRGGGHLLANGDATTDGGWGAFAGAEWLGSAKWGAGLDGFFTRYEDFGTGLDVVQLAPKFGCVLATGSDWTLRADTRGYWIHLGEDVGFALRNFFSVEERVSLYWQPWTFAAFGWTGRQVFAARGDGATIFNLPEKHTAGCGAEVKLTLSDRANVGFRFNREEFRELASTTTAAAHTFIALLGVTF